MSVITGFVTWTWTSCILEDAPCCQLCVDISCLELCTVKSAGLVFFDGPLYLLLG